jgi:uncharacterized protein (TIGR02246 family)
MGTFLIAGAALASESAEKAINARTDEFVAAWQRDDAAAMAAVFLENGDIITPFGRRADVEKLFQEEHTTFLKGTTLVLTARAYRFPASTVAIADWEASIQGIKGPDGAPAPESKFHVTQVWVERGGKWYVMASRPAFAAPIPGSAPK